MPDNVENARSQILTRLQQVSDLLASADDDVSVFNRLIDLVIKLTGANRGYILLHKTQQDTYQVMAARNATGGSASGDISAGRYLIDLALNSGQTMITEDMTKDDRNQGSITGGDHLASIVVKPLRTRGRIFGFICIDSQEKNAFSGDDVKFLEIVANQTALAIDNGRLRQTLVNTSQAKNEYISLVTHQLRVPLTSISGYSDMMLNGMAGPLSERQHGFQETIKRNVDRMSTLVGVLSDLNRLETDRMKIKLTDFDIALLIDEINDKIQASIEARNQDLIIEVAPELPPIHADRVLVGRVLDNLIANASQYTAEGGSIHVKVELSDSVALTRVSDNGIGISVEDQEQLFTPFFRSEDEFVRQYVGWGLGLAVSKKLVEALGGEMGFQSRLREGSAFSFTLPITFGELFEPI